MATPFPVPLRPTSEQSKTHNDSQPQPNQPLKPTTIPRGRKPTKVPPRKKQPQRGMGVAQLEILRVQEEIKLNKTFSTQTNHLHSLNLQPGAHSFLPDPIQSFPVHCGSVSYGIPISNGGGLWSFDQSGLVFKRVENGGFGHGSGQFLLNHHVFGAPDTRSLVGCTGSSFETSKELSSMPNMMQHLENTPSDVCSKKTRFNGESTSIGYQDGRGEKFSQKSSMNCSGYLGLNLENKTDPNNDKYNQKGGFGSRAARSAFCANRDFTESVEVVAIHRKANPTMGRRNVLMEYEFFPGKRSGKSGTRFNEMELPAEDSVAEVGNGGGVRNSYYTASNATSNSIDLSLKLSF